MRRPTMRIRFESLSAGLGGPRTMASIAGDADWSGQNQNVGSSLPVASHLLQFESVSSSPP